jgi:crotonobetainyl-CoA:carnitine CoA-transferase CaiB-like acyl-CoA transferase
MEGIRVLELGQVISAPYAGLLLADLGAEVIKIERPGVGDSARDAQVTDMHGHSATFVTFNRNKKSVALDLSEEGDYSAFLSLVARSDVVLSNLLPPAARRLGVDPDTLRRHNPRLITCMITSYGSSAPESEHPSYDLIHQALSGFMMLNGQESDPPIRMGIPLADLAAGMFSAYGVLGALQGRERTGRGDSIDISMYECMIHLLSYQATMYLTAGIIPQRMGSAHEYVVPWQAFQTLDGWLVVAARANHFWSAMCTAMRLEHLGADPRFADNTARLSNRHVLEAILAEEFRRDDTGTWLKRLVAAGVPTAPVRTVPEALDAEAERPGGLIHTASHPDLGAMRMAGNPVHYAELELVEHLPAPELDADREVLEG